VVVGGRYVAARQRATTITITITINVDATADHAGRGSLSRIARISRIAIAINSTVHPIDGGIPGRIVRVEVAPKVRVERHLAAMQAHVVVNAGGGVVGRDVRRDVRNRRHVRYVRGDLPQRDGQRREDARGVHMAHAVPVVDKGRRVIPVIHMGYVIYVVHVGVRRERRERRHVVQRVGRRVQRLEGVLVLRDKDGPR